MLKCFYSRCQSGGTTVPLELNVSVIPNQPLRPSGVLLSYPFHLLAFDSWTTSVLELAVQLPLNTFFEQAMRSSSCTANSLCNRSPDTTPTQRTRSSISLKSRRNRLRLTDQQIRRKNKNLCRLLFVRTIQTTSVTFCQHTRPYTKLGPCIHSHSSQSTSTYGS